MFRNFDLILLRHAEAQHNMIKKQIREKRNLKKGDQVSELKELRLNQNFRDQHITEKGKQQCQTISNSLNWDSIQIIFVSPLRRCLDTCRQVLKVSSKNIEVIVEPSISGMLTSIWSLGSLKKDLENEYPQFNFNKLVDDNKVSWYFRHLCQSKQRKIYELDNCSTVLEHGIKQDSLEFRHRVEQFSNILQHHLSKIKPGARILVISHNKVFANMTAKHYNEKGKGVSDLTFNNAQANYVSFGKCFKIISPSL